MRWRFPLDIRLTLRPSHSATLSVTSNSAAQRFPVSEGDSVSPPAKYTMRPRVREGLPSHLTAPASGHTRPAIILSSVVLPDPLGQRDPRLRPPAEGTRHPERPAGARKTCRLGTVRVPLPSGLSVERIIPPGNETHPRQQGRRGHGENAERHDVRPSPGPGRATSAARMDKTRRCLTWRVLLAPYRPAARHWRPGATHRPTGYSQR